MALQIANPAVVAKVERLATAMGVTKTAAVEHAVDSALKSAGDMSRDNIAERMSAILAQFDRISDRPGWTDPLEWDADGLPR